LQKLCQTRNAAQICARLRSTDAVRRLKVQARSPEFFAGAIFVSDAVNVDGLVGCQMMRTKASGHMSKYASNRDFF
jgi:hypothetical protein